MAGDNRTFDEPSDVRVVEGVVEMNGPDAVEVTFTPEAAEETSDRLLEGAMKARGNRRLGDHPHKPK